MNGYIQVITTTAERADAQKLARALVEQRLAACVQIVGPIESTYHWQGNVETGQEFQCWIKTRSDLYEALEQAILKLHPYSVPEVLAIPVLAGSESYLQWLGQELRPDTALPTE
jgi:periplasmic divalent cation tolerance protein